MFIRSIGISVVLVLLSGCSTRGVKSHKNTQSSSKLVASTKSQSYSNVKSTQKKSSNVDPTMRPYTVFGKRYYPTKVRIGETFYGVASWYGPYFDGKATSSGEIYNKNALTAAHKTLPMNTLVKVINRDNGKSVIVRIIDRGPFVDNRIIDLSNKAAHAIDMVKKGTANVKLEVVGFKDQKSANYGAASHSKAKVKKHLNYDVYALQIGSFSKIDGALKTQDQYDGYKGYHTLIKDTRYNGKRVFRVWLSGFKSEAEARAFKENSPFPHAFIVGE